jgi:phage N-6-adenine-methyltransferase
MEGMEELQRQLWKKTGISTPSTKLQDRWRTPPRVFQGAAELVGGPFALDVAATEEDTLCQSWIGPEQNALDSKPWALNYLGGKVSPELRESPAYWGEVWDTDHPWTAWCNPPYSNHPQSSQYLWADRCHLAASRGWTVALLIPAAPTTRCGQLCAMTAHEIHYTAGRIAFLHPDSGKPVSGNPLGSQLVIFRPPTSDPPTKGMWKKTDKLRWTGAPGAPHPRTLKVTFGWSP